jgi:polysaccharide pyruvyl transferase WcaK-like protein
MDYTLGRSILQELGPDIEQGLDYLKSADSVHLVGGGYITDYHYPNYIIPRLVLALKKQVGFKLFATGLGLEPLSQESRVILRTIFQGFDAVDLRDKESYLAIANGSSDPRITMSVDDAFLAPTNIAPDNKDAGRLVIIAQQDEIVDPVLPFLLNLIEACPFALNGVTMPLLDIKADKSLAEKVRDLSGSPVEIIKNVDMFRKGIPIRRQDFVFSTRFHGHLMASVIGASGICASVRLPYYDIKHRSLVDLGSGFDLIGMHDFPFDAYDWHTVRETFLNKYQELHARKMQVVGKLYI